MNEPPFIRSWKIAIWVVGIFCFAIQLPAAALTAEIKSDFADPPITYWPRPLWFWNNTEVKVEVLREQMQKSKALSKYGGFGILPFGKSFGPEYLGEQYFAVYGSVLAGARESGMTMSLYDEYGFPSGPAGAPNSSDVSLFERQFPELTIKRLDKHEETVTGPAQYHKDLPPGQIMSVVAMNTATKERVELAEKTREHRLGWSVPAGTWKIMVFTCVKDGYPPRGAGRQLHARSR